MPTVVPMIIETPSLRSTLPNLPWRMVETIDFPPMCARSVPIAYGMGKPKMLSAGVTIQAPPIPKNPPQTPTVTPISSRSRMLNSMPAIGR
jgi:hypothetical protein